ncbi:hypothetical protein JOD64_005278 [Micromonospora luteifusca]|uniref:Uncharacterized protein n=1 Tax=Micromonospora luteifusca TaxID=709860 RepID=A0ABS2M0V2_9ACTN|nr:hypothetical protein [Micromonospora luteifusca]
MAEPYACRSTSARGKPTNCSLLQRIAISGTSRVTPKVASLSPLAAFPAFTDSAELPIRLLSDCHP